MKLHSLVRFLLPLVFFLSAYTVRAYDWTYHASVPTTGTPVQFFLWVPEQAPHVRAVILCSEARLSQLAGDSVIRKAFTEARMGIIGFKGGTFTSSFNENNLDDEYLQEGLQKLADVSGFTELAHVPLATYGTSVGGIFAWQAAWWNPGRFFAIVEDNSIYSLIPSWAGSRTLAGIPILVSRGSEEQVADKWPATRDTVLAMRRKGYLASMIMQAGCGHFVWTQWEARYVSAFLVKAAARRIPQGQIAENGPLTLNPIAEDTGWLTDSAFKGTLTTDSFSTYSSDKNQAYWHLDKELAQLWVEMHQGNFDKSRQYIDLANYTCAPETPFTTCQTLVVGSTPYITLGATTDAPGRTLSYTTYNGALSSRGSDTAWLRESYRVDGGTGWFVAYQEGDESYQCAEYAVRFASQRKNTGTSQSISFTPLPDVADTADPFVWAATASSGLPVEARILSGAAEIIGDKIYPRPFPRGTSKVIVRYCQNGNGAYQTATCKEDTFLINRVSPPVTGGGMGLVPEKSERSVNPNPATDWLRIWPPVESRSLRVSQVGGQTTYLPVVQAEENSLLPLHMLTNGVWILHLPEGPWKFIKE